MIRLVVKAHSLWSRTNTDFHTIRDECGLFIASFGVLSGTVEILAYRVSLFFIGR